MLGSFTTFSTFSFETVKLAGDGHMKAALANVGASVLLGLLAVLLGSKIAGAVGRRTWRSAACGPGSSGAPRSSKRSSARPASWSMGG